MVTNKEFHQKREESGTIYTKEQITVSTIDCTELLILIKWYKPKGKQQYIAV